MHSTDVFAPELERDEPDVSDASPSASDTSTQKINAPILPKHIALYCATFQPPLKCNISVICALNFTSSCEWRPLTDLHSCLTGMRVWYTTTHTVHVHVERCGEFCASASVLWTGWSRVFVSAPCHAASFINRATLADTFEFGWCCMRPIK